MNTETWFYGHGSFASDSAKGKTPRLHPRDFENKSIYLFEAMRERFYEMAGKKGKTPTRFGNTEFVNVSLTSEQIKEFKAWYPAILDNLHDELGQIMVDDYKVSCNWDDNNQCFIATFTGKQDQSFNSEKALSSRSDNWFEALGINLFKHVVVFGTKTWDGETAKNNWG